MGVEGVALNAVVEKGHKQSKNMYNMVPLM